MSLPAIDAGVVTRQEVYPGMTWIPGGTFCMGSDRHYPEE
jgi:formylglycine-generating enzyme required for sulfatase activity